MCLYFNSWCLQIHIYNMPQTKHEIEYVFQIRIQIFFTILSIKVFTSNIRMQCAKGEGISKQWFPVRRGYHDMVVIREVEFIHIYNKEN